VLDSEGIHHVAWQTSEGLGYATNEEGDFAEEEVARGDGGTLPVLGIGAEDTVWLGWMDAEETEVQLALRSEDEPLLALPSPQPTAAGTAPTAECEPQGTDLAIAAPPGAVTDGFDTDCLAVPAGQPYTIAFDNQDEGQIHNVNVYTDQSASESLLLPPLEGGITGPDTTTYEGDPIDEAGNFFFQCDYHAASMTGTFVVAEAKN
jgi:plastocyanin